MTLSGPDVSHHQGSIDWPKVRAAGHSLAMLKATESTNYKDPLFNVNRANARAAGLATGAYHFARAGDPVAEADWFLQGVGSLYPGELAVLDWEVHHPNAPGWCATWLNRVRDALGVKPLIYMNYSASRGSNWQPVIAGDYGLWLARYNGTADKAGTEGTPWPFVAMKQYTDKGQVPGIGGHVDLNVFFGSAETLARYGKGGGAPSPAPAPQPPAPPKPTPAPAFNVLSWRASEGDNDPHLPALRRWANRMFPAYQSTPMDEGSTTHYGPQTVAFVKEFGSRVGIRNDGRDIGPRIAKALHDNGFRG